LLAVLGGGCQVPIGAHATIEGSTIHLHAIVASPDGERVIRGELSGSDAFTLGRLLGEQLLKDGAREILSAAYSA
jgi:hydroxymethylbilane synthase